ncbi:unnamed protein product [Leptosia nina]|uniref:F-box domain-containing protein n=1 Tax=Leptosia nina TaxID=320188 RepID=A0AAV1JZ94_9NEOP
MSRKRGDTTYTNWGNCSFDILIKIFQKLPYKDIHTCFKINQAWQDAVVYYCNHYRLWKNLVNETIFDCARSIKERSVLFNPKAIYLNHIIWEHIISSAEYEIAYYDFACKKIHVNKDKLILVLENSVKVLNPFDFAILKTVNKKVVDYYETSHLIVLVDKMNHEEVKVSISDCNGKQKIEDYLFCENSLLVHNDLCWCMKSDRTIERINWIDSSFVCKFYNTHSNIGLVVYHNKPYLFTNAGCVYAIVGQDYRLESHWSMPGLADSVLCWLDRFTAVYGSKSATQVRQLHDTDVLTFVIPRLTAATRHGNYLLLGYVDGLLEVHDHADLNQMKMKPKKKMQLDYNEPINALEVWQGKQTHIILAAIGDKLAKIRLSYFDQQYFK